MAVSMESTKTGLSRDLGTMAITSGLVSGGKETEGLPVTATPKPGFKSGESKDKYKARQRRRRDRPRVRRQKRR
jgi:hypothetical protein